MAEGAPTRRTVARAVSWVSVGHIVSQGLWLVSLLVLAALLSPKDFGTLASALVLVNLAGLLVDSGTRGSIIASERLTRSDIRGAIALNGAVGLGATLAIALLAGPAVRSFAGGGDVAAVRALSAGVFLYAIGITAYALLQKRLRLKQYAAANIVSAVLSSIVAVIAGLLGAGVWALVIRQLLSMGLLSLFAWVFARDLLPAAEPGEGERRWRDLVRLRQPQWTAFFLLAAADFVVLNADVFVVGGLTDARDLGVYSLAFTLAFAPLTQIAWQIGRVLFPAAAANPDTSDVGRRTLVSLRLMGLLLLPFVAPVIALAPVLPQVLGEKWHAIVVPFQLLVLAGVGQALTVVIGESLSGTGNVGFRARINVVWALATVGAMIGLVEADGIRGAAIAHLALFTPFAAVYVVVATRRLHTSPGDLARALRPLALPILLEALATGGAYVAGRGAGASSALAGGIAAAVGAAAAAALLLGLPSSPLREGRAVLGEALGREVTAA